MPLRIVSKKDWSWFPPYNTSHPVAKFSRVFLVNTHTRECGNTALCKKELQSLEQRVEAIPFSHGMRHNFLVGGDGNVYEARGWHIQPDMPKKFIKFKSQGMLIGFLGDYTAETMPDQVDQATRDLIQFGVKQGYISVDYQFYDILATRWPTTRQ